MDIPEDICGQLLMHEVYTTQSQAIANCMQGCETKTYQDVMCYKFLLGILRVKVGSPDFHASMFGGPAAFFGSLTS